MGRSRQTPGFLFSSSLDNDGAARLPGWIGHSERRAVTARRSRTSIKLAQVLVVVVTFLVLSATPVHSTVNATQLWQWGPVADLFPQSTDIWSAPASARIFDTNEDGFVTNLDDPSLVFISGNAGGGICQSSGTSPTACHTGVLRVLNGRTGEEQFSLDKASAMSSGFAGISVAIGPILGNGSKQIAAVTGEGQIVLIGSNTSPPTIRSMIVLGMSDTPIPNASVSAFGSGGALALGDMDADQSLEIAYGRSVYKATAESITLLFEGTAGFGGVTSYTALSTFAELDGASGLELIAGRTVYHDDSSLFWDRSDLPDGYVAIADMDGDSGNEVVLVANGSAYILEGNTGTTLLQIILPGSGSGGPPVLADFDGDGAPEIGVSMAGLYTVLDPDLEMMTLNVLWSATTHDVGSSVTGSSAFDFDDDGRAEVVEADQCFLWVFDGATGAVRLGLSHTSTTSNEMPIASDIDGDGRAELAMVSNGADPQTWGCVDGGLTPLTVNGTTWTPSGIGNGAYRGMTILNASSGEWPDALSLWGQHGFRANSKSFRLGGIEALVFKDGFEAGAP
jgi:hypothetical protein